MIFYDLLQSGVENRIGPRDYFELELKGTEGVQSTSTVVPGRAKYSASELDKDTDF
jgi:hypothetical protein